MSKDEIRVCPFPFARTEVGHRNAFVPCCRTWFNQNYDELLKEGQNDNFSWNGVAARKLRESILDGSYKYCHTDRCNKPVMSLSEIRQADPDYFETPISEANLEAIEQGQARLPEGPTSLSLMADLKCNLACPTCRTSLKTTDNDNEVRQISRELFTLENSKSTLEVLKLANSGEVFFSQDQRDLLKRINKTDFPRLKHIFVITNGLLFDQKTFDALRPGTEFIKKVAVSIDAGDEATYKITRGGDWHRLMRNLDWMSQKRARGDFNTFNLNIVVRKANFQSIPELIELGRKLAVDRVEMTQFDNWTEFYSDFEVEMGETGRYADEAIHLSENPLHNDLVEMLKIYRNDPMVAINIGGLKLD